MTHSKKQKAITLMVYFLLFYAVWAVYHVWIAPFLTAQISSDWLCSLVANGIFKNLIWTLPAAILLCRFSGDVYPKGMLFLESQSVAMAAGLSVLCSLPALRSVSAAWRFADSAGLRAFLGDCRSVCRTNRGTCFSRLAAEPHLL